MLERTGGLDPATGTYLNVDADGGAYDTGSVYLLFLKEQPGTGYYFLINDQARYEVLDGHLEAIEETGAVAEVLLGLSLGEAIDAIRGA